MYVGFALWTLGLAILVDSAWMLLAVPIGLVLIDRIVIAREERYLERKFGDEISQLQTPCPALDLAVTALKQFGPPLSNMKGERTTCLILRPQIYCDHPTSSKALSQAIIETVQ